MRNVSPKRGLRVIIFFGVVLMACTTASPFIIPGTATPTITEAAAPTLTETVTQLVDTPTPTEIRELSLWGREDSSVVIHQRLGKGAAYALAVSPDGKTLAVTGILNASTYDYQSLDGIWTSPLEQIQPQPLSSIGRGAVEFAPDGGRLATVSDIGITVWDAVTGLKLGTYKQERGLFYSIAWAGDGKLTAWGSVEGRVRLWDVESGLQLFELEPKEGLHHFEWSPDAAVMAVGLTNGKVVFWDTRANTPVYAPLEICTGYCIGGLKWSPDGTRLSSVSKGQEGKVTAWEPRTGMRLFENSIPSGSEVSVMSWSPDNAYLAAALQNKEILIWDGQTGQLIQSMRKSHSAASDKVLSLAWSPDGRELIALSRYAPVTVWDVRTGKEIRALDEHGTWVLGLAWSPDGDRIASGYEDGEIIVWKSQTGEKEWSSRGQFAWVTGLAWSPDGGKIASVAEKSITIWDARTGDQLDSWSVSSWTLFGVAWSPDGGRLASVTYEGSAIVWDAATGVEVLRLPENRFTGSLSWSPRGDLLATSYPDDETDREQVTLWDARTGEPVRTVVGLYGADWSPDGKMIASVSDNGTRYLGDDQTLVLWDPDTGKSIRRFPEEFGPDSFDWSPDGNYFIAAQDEHRCLFVLNARTGDPIHVLQGHVDFVGPVRWSPRGNWIASASWDGTVILWGVEAA